MNEDIKKLTKKKMAWFPKNVVHFGFFTNEMECERDKQILVIKWSFLMQPESLYFNTKMSEKWVSINIIQLVSFNYYKVKSAKEIADMFSLEISDVYNIISCAEKEGPLDLKAVHRQAKIGDAESWKKNY